MSGPPKHHDEEVATARILARCAELGFALAGVAPAETVTHHGELYEWLEAGMHGQMAWMEERVAERVDPRKMVVGARSVIVVADRYSDGGADEAVTANGMGRVARYARGSDYHKVMKERLHQLCDELVETFPGEKFKTCVDTAPVLEREHACKAGIGYVGKNTMLIEPGVGSYLLLGEVVTTLQLRLNERALGDHCGACDACIRACPTGAIEPWRVDARRCISYLTIEHRGVIEDDAIRHGMGEWIFGCDICQEVCPHNGEKPATREAPTHPAYAERREGFDLLEVLGWDEETRRNAFVTSALKRAKLGMMKRNALIAAGNWLSRQNDATLLTRIKEIAGDEREEAMVRQTANQVIRALAKQEHE